MMGARERLRKRWLVWEVVSPRCQLPEASRVTGERTTYPGGGQQIVDVEEAQHVEQDLDGQLLERGLEAAVVAAGPRPISILAVRVRARRLGTDRRRPPRQLTRRSQAGLPRACRGWSVRTYSYDELAAARGRRCRIPVHGGAAHQRCWDAMFDEEVEAAAADVVTSPRRRAASSSPAGRPAVDGSAAHLGPRARAGPRRRWPVLGAGKRRRRVAMGGRRA